MSVRASQGAPAKALDTTAFNRSTLTVKNMAAALEWNLRFNFEAPKGKDIENCWPTANHSSQVRVV